MLNEIFEGIKSGIKILLIAAIETGKAVKEIIINFFVK